MKNIRLGFIVAGALVIGGTVFVSSTFAGTEPGKGLTVIKHSEQQSVKKRVASRVQPAQEANAAEHKVALVAPPKELDSSPATQMVTSIKPVAPAAQPARNASGKAVKKAKADKVVVAQAPAQKTVPQNLFTLVRLLNYAPHPLNEELLKHAPLTLEGKNYWFSLNYDEDWKVINDDEGYIKGISFEIEVMENNAKVRSMKTPKVVIDPAKIKKGQVLGVAEVAPYKFTISVEEFTKSKKGVSELVFKLDLVG